MRVAIRTDASVQIGTGHLMRCLTLADALRKENAQTVFICRSLSEHFRDLIKSRGHTIHQLQDVVDTEENSEQDLRHGVWLGVDWQTDAQQTASALETVPVPVDWLIVDHYALDARWESRLRLLARKIMVIDDLADRSHDCNLLLDQNLHEDMATRYNGLLPTSCQTLLGPHYALLRPEFREARENLRERDGQVRRILIFFGGADPTNETTKALEAFKALDRQDIMADVVVGSTNPHKGDIEQVCGAEPNINFYVDVDNMAQLMALADLAIGAGGTTTWERCCLGLPCLTIAIAANQVAPAEALAKTNINQYLGSMQEVTSKRIEVMLGAMVSNPLWLRFMSEQTAGLVDGRGTYRVLTELIHDEELALRPVRMEDSDDIYLWRNAEETRQYSLNPNPIERATHDKWLADVLADPNRILLIGEDKSEPVGVLRYDLSGNEAIVSIYLVPGKTGRGYGSRLLREGTCWIVEHKPNVTKIMAEILSMNEASIRAFSKAGYQLHKCTYCLPLKGTSKIRS